MLSVQQNFSPSVAAAARQDYFAIGETVERAGGRLEAGVARTNELGAIPPDALAEIKNSPSCRPVENSQHWQKVGRGPSFPGLEPVEPGQPLKPTGEIWASDVYTLKINPEVVLLCHNVELP